MTQFITLLSNFCNKMYRTFKLSNTVSQQQTRISEALLPISVAVNVALVVFLVLSVAVNHIRVSPPIPARRSGSNPVFSKRRLFFRFRLDTQFCREIKASDRRKAKNGSRHVAAMYRHNARSTQVFKEQHISFNNIQEHSGKKQQWQLKEQKYAKIHIFMCIDYPSSRQDYNNGTIYRYTRTRDYGSNKAMERNRHLLTQLQGQVHALTPRAVPS